MARWHGPDPLLGWRFRTFGVAEMSIAVTAPASCSFTAYRKLPSRITKDGSGIPVDRPGLGDLAVGVVRRDTDAVAVRAEVQRAAGLAACSLAAGSRGVRAFAFRRLAGCGLVDRDEGSGEAEESPAAEVHAATGTLTHDGSPAGELNVTVDPITLRPRYRGSTVSTTSTR